jgi:hypothetical protein
LVAAYNLFYHRPANMGCLCDLVWSHTLEVLIFYVYF